MPETMKRVVLVQPDADMSKVQMEVEEVPVPTPRNGEVLIRVSAAPVNPSDYGEWKTVPKSGEFKRTALGKEGSGVVVGSTNMMGRRLLGTNVGFVKLPKGQGAYSEYVTANVMQAVFPMPKDVPVEDCCSFFVNPYTVYGMLDTMKKNGSPGLVHGAAASQLGKMMVKACLERNIPLVNLVRREEQAELLRGLGAQYVVVTGNKTKEEWQGELSALIKELDISIAFDPIAGEMTGELLSLMPPGGACHVYGVLSGKPVCAVHPLDLIYRNKKLEGFFLTRWIIGDGGTLGMLGRLRAAAASVNPGLSTGWSKTAFEDTTLEGMFPAFLARYQGGGFTDSKLRIRMGGGVEQ